MVVYELTHLFFKYRNEFVYSPKKLGFFYSYENTENAIQYYSTKPGFCKNNEAFSAKRKSVHGKICNDNIYEVIVYFHSEDYEFETEIDLGLYGNEKLANQSLARFCNENARLIGNLNFTLEKIVNKYTIEKKEWAEGFSI